MRVWIDFIDNVSKNINHFKEKHVVVEVKQYLNERLKKFKENALVLNENVSQEHAIKIDNIDNLLGSLSKNKDILASSSLKASSK